MVTGSIAANPSTRLTCELNRLFRIAQQPESSSQYDPRAFVIKTEAAGFGGVGRWRWRERGFQVRARLDLISDQMMREAEQRMCGHYPDWIGHFLRDSLALLGDREHPIEIARPSIETVQLADEAKLFDWIVKLLRELQTSHEGGMRLLTAPHCVHRGNSEACLQMHLLGPPRVVSSSASIARSDQR